MISDIGKQKIREEWRELGFFYDVSENEHLWRFVGSKQGLFKFYNLLLDYAADPRNNKASEHEHYGPYLSLEIMTWDKPGIDNHSIHGSIEDIRRLANILKEKIEDAEEGDRFSIEREFAPNCEYSISIEVKENNFDPASPDLQLQD